MLEDLSYIYVFMILIFWKYCRLELFGWIGRHQFEETWMALLCVLNSTPSENTPAEELPFINLVKQNFSCLTFLKKKIHTHSAQIKVCLRNLFVKTLFLHSTEFITGCKRDYCPTGTDSAAPTSGQSP